MYATRLFNLLTIVALLMLAACAPQLAATPAADEPVTLHLAVADEEGRPSDPYVRDFIEQAKTLSNGNITIEPTWDAGANTSAGFEKGTIELVTGGKADLGLAASRAWDTENVMSFQALQAPFLIDNDALAIAVAQSDVARRMLEGLSSAGVVGLTLWPEDLRHPFSTIPNKPILSPDDFKGSTVRVTPSEVSQSLIQTFGGNPISDGDYQAAESGLRQGFTLTGTPTATGNVNFFAKYQVLFANGGTFGKLSDVQRNILREAAAAAQKKAIAEHLSEADAAKAWCADGGTIVLASNEQVAAFQKAVQPVFDNLLQDSFNAQTIAAIRELKAKTQPSTGAQACAPTVAIATQASLENQTWSQGLLPNGVWQVELTADDLFAVGGILKSAAQESAGVHTFTFQDGKFTWSLKGDHPGYGEGTYTVVGDVVRLAFASAYGTEVDDIQWRLDDDGLHFHLVAIKDAPFADIKANLEAKPYQKVETYSTGLPPNGVWQVEMTADDFIKNGVLNSTAADMAAVYTWTFQDGQAKIEINGPRIKVSCMVVATVVGDAVRLQNVASPDCDGNAYDDVQWRLDTDGLHFHLVSSQAEELRAMYEAKPWQKTEQWSQGLPPNGVWQVDLTPEDFVQMGMLQSVAESDWAGLQTLTLKDGKSLGVWHGLQGQTAKCQANYEVVGDVVRFTYYSDADECVGQVDEVQWRLDGDGLHFRVVDLKNVDAVGAKTYYEAKPWKKIADS